MLARLDAMKAGATVEVDRSGTLVRVSPPTRASEVRELLVRSGATAEILNGPDAASAVASATAWFSRGNIRELTREEFRVLVRQWVETAKEGVSLSAAEVAALVAALDAAMDREIAKMPLEDGLPKDAKAWAATKRRVVDQALEDLKVKLTLQQIEALRGTLYEEID